MGDSDRVRDEVEPLREPETFREFLHLRFTGRDKAFMPGGKINVHARLDELGFPHAHLYRVWDTARDISLVDLPSEFVIKPNELASKRGVFVLHEIAGGLGYWDALGNRRVWGGMVRSELAEFERLWLETRNRPFRIIVEERIRGEYRPKGIPLDYKFYTFNGEIRLILQIDRNVVPPAITFYDRDFGPWDIRPHLTPGRQMQMGEPIVPSCGSELIEMVRRLSRMLRTPFVSIDTYVSQRGPLIGELTRSPGGPYYQQMWTFSAAYERELAECWKRAAAELNVSLGLIDPKEKIPAKRTLPSVSKTPVG